MADKIVVMQAGHIEQIGAPVELYDRPANTFVAGFIGSPSMNFMEATVKTGEGGAAAQVNGHAFRLGDANGLSDGQRVLIGIRPENTRVSDAGLAGEVAVVEHTGSEIHLVVRSGGKDFVSIIRERQKFAPGQKVALAAEPDAIHVFDPSTGKRMN